MKSIVFPIQIWDAAVLLTQETGLLTTPSKIYTISCVKNNRPRGITHKQGQVTRKVRTTAPTASGP